MFALSFQGCAKQEQTDYNPQQPRESKEYKDMIAILPPRDDILEEIEIKYKQFNIQKDINNK